MIRRPPRSTLDRSSAASDVYKRQEFERMGDGHRTFAVLVQTFDGIPLIYSGQEEPLKKRLAFFQKDDIGFKTYEYCLLYTSPSPRDRTRSRMPSSA